MGIVDTAIKKINGEMQQRADDKYVEIIGQYVIDRCAVEGDAQRVTEEKKTLKGAMDAVMELARKNKNGSVAVLTPEQVFGAVDRYFGFKKDRAAQTAALGGAAPAPEPAPEKPRMLDIADFM